MTVAASSIGSKCGWTVVASIVSTSATSVACALARESRSTMAWCIALVELDARDSIALARWVSAFRNGSQSGRQSTLTWNASCSAITPARASVIAFCVTEIMPCFTAMS